MAKKRELEVSIAPDGTVQVHVTGFPGKQCLKVKEMLEEIVTNKQRHIERLNRLLAA